MKINNKEKGYKINSFGRMAVWLCVVFLVAVLAIFAEGIYPSFIANARDGGHLIQMQSSLDEQSGMQKATSFTDGLPGVVHTDSGRSGTPTPTSGLTVTNTSNFAGGDGTAQNPYLISTPEQLDNVRNNMGTFDERINFRLVGDIDLAEFLSYPNRGYNNGEGWQPLGCMQTSFFGNFDGRGYAISGLWINRPSQRYVGLFAAIDGIVSNLNLVLDKRGIVGYERVGGISGFNQNRSGQGIRLQNLSVKGNVYGAEHIGGLFGRVSGVVNSIEIFSSMFVGVVSTFDQSIPGFTRATSSVVGGIIGNAQNVTISNSLVRADIRPYQDAQFVFGGGIVGWFQGANNIVTNSFIELTGYADFMPFFGGRTPFGFLAFATVKNSFYTGFYGGQPLGVELDDVSGKFDDYAQLDGWDFDAVWGFDKEENLVLRVFGLYYDPTRAVVVNITGTGAEGVTHDALNTILQTETVLEFTLMGVSNDAKIILPYGANLNGMTVTIPITAGGAALTIDIIITAYVPPPPPPPPPQPTPPPPPPPDLTWLWILLGIIGGLALISGAVLLALKLKKPKVITQTVTETIEVEKEVVVEREVIKEVPVIKKALPSDLSDKEREVAILVLKGLSRSKIALKMEIAESTVSTYMERIYIKSGVDNQKEFLARFTGEL